MQTQFPVNKMQMSAVVHCWHGYLLGARCRFAYSPADADATATHCLFKEPVLDLLEHYAPVNPVPAHPGSLTVYTRVYKCIRLVHNTTKHTKLWSSLLSSGQLSLLIQGGRNQLHPQRHIFQFTMSMQLFKIKMKWISTKLPSVLWRCWLGGRKGIRPVKNWMVVCWRGYLPATRCRFAYGPADATATHCLLLQEIQIGLPFWYRLMGKSRTKSRAVKRL